jgi:hypothetical protein
MGTAGTLEQLRNYTPTNLRTAAAGSPLTNPESRRLGLGPKCRKHYGL